MSGFPDSSEPIPTVVQRGVSAPGVHEKCSFNGQNLPIEFSTTATHFTMPPTACHRKNAAGRRHGFTLLEVMVSTVLIAIAMGNILMMNIRAARVLRASREVAATSQVLQQRIEMVRERPWAEVAGVKAMAALMKTPTDSEAELSESHLTERMRVTVPRASADGLVETERTFSVCRTDGVVVIEQADDFVAQPTLLFEGSVTWRDPAGVHQRVLRTVVCRIGLTRSGIVGTVLGRPGSRVPRP